ncbi:hypothetical protein QFZ22_001252 [Streptomyces canus]|uniref:AraC family transcriptional regulator n=1 Tax=Streptomyces canus TaxID=58343 RepID=A0AAW8F558_9ACTN|nr:hypothetical protein [Streptomyces canus]MDQ0905267.1 hypothetical protein [Streptomyces canus]
MFPNRTEGRPGGRLEGLPQREVNDQQVSVSGPARHGVDGRRGEGSRTVGADLGAG